MNETIDQEIYKKMKEFQDEAIIRRKKIKDMRMKKISPDIIYEDGYYDGKVDTISLMMVLFAQMKLEDEEKKMLSPENDTRPNLKKVIKSGLKYLLKCMGITFMVFGMYGIITSLLSVSYDFWMSSWMIVTSVVSMVIFMCIETYERKKEELT